jgi:hypothetical protein
VWSISTLLDPRYKSIFLSSDQLSDIKFDFLEKFQSSHDKSESHPQDLNETDISSLTFTQKHILKKQGKGTYNCDGEQNCQLELLLSSYLNEAYEDINSCPLKWWQEIGKAKFPFLYKCAKHFLAIPASEVSSERVFSYTGNILSDERSSLSTQKVEMLLFIKQNMKFL